jgi:putative oxidoreductase
MKRLLQTPNDLAMTFARLALGIMILPHGLQKTFGWFGGRGFEATMQGMSESFPPFLVLLAIAAELLGGLGLILGALTRIAALGVGVTMAVALTRHIDNGFFMNWSGKQAGEGFEFHILAIGLALAVLIRGAGAFSIDRELAGTKGSKRG